MIWCAKLKIIPAICIRENNKRRACVDRLLEVKNTHIDAQPGSWDEGLLERATRGGYGQIIRMLVERAAKISKKMVDTALVLDNLRECGGKDKVQEGGDDEEGVQEEEVLFRYLAWLEIMAVIFEKIKKGFADRLRHTFEVSWDRMQSIPNGSKHRIIGKQTSIIKAFVCLQYNITRQIPVKTFQAL
ncbi:Uncharacterized protein HZ326_4061 [Fusarium oxysporum f. sp. albedinis]|nr:Uncharacterized protein HZ326_4061 [Fusarium oxysporum f. sp. albedinis]